MLVQQQRSARNVALMNVIGACGVLLIVAVSCIRVPQLDSLSFLKTLTCYALVVNCVTAWFFKGISSTSQRCSAVSSFIIFNFFLSQADPAKPL